jgi:hypothetical protein
MDFPINESLINKIAQVLKSRDNISFAYIYGSSLKDITTAQDLDIAVFLKHYTGLIESECKEAEEIKEALEPIINKPIDVKVMNDAPVEFQLEVIETGRPIYISDEVELTNYLEELSRKAIETIQYRYSLEGELCRL